MSTLLINDSQRLVSATSRFGHPIPVYDDGFGLLYIHRDSMGISGIVRAQSWEDAYSICEDEFFPEADETMEEIEKEYNFRSEHKNVIRDSTAPAGEHTSAGERFAEESDYINGRLPDNLFVRWETVETPQEDSWADNELFQDAFGFRPNGANAKDIHKHGIYAKDLNGDSLDILTPALLAELEITLVIEDQE